MFQRPHIKELTARILEPRKHIQVVMGPRQVGKTTLTLIHILLWLHLIVF